MGIFGFKTKYDILPNVEDLKALVTNYNNVDVVKMNAKLVVPDNHFFIIGKRGKALDRFDPGEYFLNTSILPYMCRRFNIDKVKNGKSQDKIPADFYFIKKDLWGGAFKTNRKAIMGTKAYGMFSVKVKGVFSYKVVEPREFMQSLLNEFDYIRTGEAEDIVNGWVGDEIFSELESKNFMLNDIVSNSPIVVDSLRLKVSKLFSTAGLDLVDFKITKYELPKEYQDASNKILKMQELGENSQSEQEQEVEIKPTYSEDCYDLSNGIQSDIQDAKALLKQFNIGEEKIEQNLNIQNPNLVEKSTITTNDDNSTTTNQNILPNSIKEPDVIKTKTASNDYVPFGDFVIESMNLKNVEKYTKPEKNFVDLTLKDIYKENIQTKRCVNCGSENHISAEHCVICGDKFVNY